jgi:hypothetical protein
VAAADREGADLHLWLREVLARRDDDVGELPAPHRLVYAVAHHPRHPVLCGPLARRAAPLAIGWRFAIATAVEAAWEIVENSDAIIERYRAVTISLDYYGDSVINSAADILAMWAGFGLARILPVWASIALIVVFEALTLYIIRDGLALNVLMLLWPLDAMRTWQAGG